MDWKVEKEMMLIQAEFPKKYREMISKIEGLESNFWDETCHDKLWVLTTGVKYYLYLPRKTAHRKIVTMIDTMTEPLSILMEANSLNVCFDDVKMLLERFFCYYEEKSGNDCNEDSINIDKSNMKILANELKDASAFQDALTKLGIVKYRGYVIDDAKKKLLFELKNETGEPDDYFHSYFSNIGKDFIIEKFGFKEIVMLRRGSDRHNKDKVDYFEGKVFLDDFKTYIEDFYDDTIFFNTLLHSGYKAYLRRLNNSCVRSSGELDTNYPLVNCLKDNVYNDKSKKIYSSCLIFVDSSNGITFRKVSVQLTSLNNKCTMTAKTTHILNCDGAKTTCLQMTRGKMVSCDPFKMFTMSDATGHYYKLDAQYENADSALMFIGNNREFLNRTGFFNVLESSSKRINWKSYLFFYFIMLAKYPQIELLTKTNHCKFIEDIYDSFYGEKATIKSRDESLKIIDELIDISASSSKFSLRVPNYISTYLANKNATMEEYIFFRDVYELTGIQKEAFEEAVHSVEYMFLKTLLDISSLKLQDILKHGYEFYKTIKYIVKQMNIFMLNKRWYVSTTTSFDSSIYNRQCLNMVVNELSDTLNMAEVMNISIEKYPNDLTQIHDELAKSYKIKMDTMGNEMMKEISESCTKKFEAALKENPSKYSEELNLYDVVFPSTADEFTQEGILQHNCVASYYESVLKHKCIIFFIHKKNMPKDKNNYITAEVVDNGNLRQVMFSNNRPVPVSSKEYKLCQFVANAIK